jgi:phosphoribosylglycinamide formyltransferase 1
MIRLAVLGSTRGTNMLAVLQAIQQKRLSASINLVISNKADALILERAQSYGLMTQFVDAKGLSREAYDQQISTLLHDHHIDLVVLIGYMRILSAPFVNEWENKIINVHPSLLPAFAGKMDLDVHRAVLEAGVPETGCTVHYVTKDVDAGPIVLQRVTALLPGDTPERLKERVQALEGEALVEAINLITKRVAFP